MAVCAPLLVGLGFTPVQAVAMAAIGHGWAVTYGSLASSFQTLIAVTGLPGEVLAPFTALLLGLSAPVAGLLVALIGNGWKGLKRAVLPVLVIGSVMGVAQYLLATNGLWTLGATGGAIAGLLVGLILVRLPAYRAKPETDVVEPPAEEDKGKSLWLSLLAYGLLVVLAFSINLIPPVDNFLSQVKFTLNFPELETSPWLGHRIGERPCDQYFRAPRRDPALYFHYLLHYLPQSWLHPEGRTQRHFGTGGQERR